VISGCAAQTIGNTVGELKFFFVIFARKILTGVLLGSRSNSSDGRRTVCRVPLCQ
jgi:hypothetical protein